jgi:hypothetical protein
MKSACSFTKIFPAAKIEFLDVESIHDELASKRQAIGVDIHFSDASLAAGRYSSSFTPRADGSSLPLAALMRSTSDFGTLMNRASQSASAAAAFLTLSRIFSIHRNAMIAVL